MTLASGRAERLGLLVLLCMVLLSIFVAGLTLGRTTVAPATVFAALLSGDGGYEHLVVSTLRLPRVVAAFVVGAGLAVAGAIMQGLTQNPLASPGLLGINAGAAFAVVLVTFLTGTGSEESYAWAAWLGAGVAAVSVYLLGSFGRGGPTPLKLTLAGTVFATFLASLTSAMLLADADTLDAVRLWTVGSLAGRSMEVVLHHLPYLLAGLAIGLAMAPQITTLSLGTDVARSLGLRVQALRLLGVLVVALLAGSAVAIAGPVGFVGLVAPHLARALVGLDYRWIVPVSAAIGALLLSAADLAGRVLLSSETVPVGIVMAIIGAPFFLYLARYKVRR